MHTPHVEQCQERGGVTVSQIEQNFHRFPFAFAGRTIFSPIMLVLQSITATILLTTLNKMNEPRTKLNVHQIGLGITAGVTIHSSNQYVNGMANARNIVVAPSLIVFGKGRARSRIFYSLVGKIFRRYLNFEHTNFQSSNSQCSHYHPQLLSTHRSCRGYNTQLSIDPAK